MMIINFLAVTIMILLIILLLICIIVNLDLLSQRKRLDRMHSNIMSSFENTSDETEKELRKIAKSNDNLFVVKGLEELNELLKDLEEEEQENE